MLSANKIEFCECYERFTCFFLNKHCCTFFYNLINILGLKFQFFLLLMIPFETDITDEAGFFVEFYENIK